MKIEISKDEALVLFEYLSRNSENGYESSHSAEVIALDNLLTYLESTLHEPFGLDYQEALLKAQKSLISSEL